MWGGDFSLLTGEGLVRGCAPSRKNVGIWCLEMAYYAFWRVIININDLLLHGKGKGKGKGAYSAS